MATATYPGAAGNTAKTEAATFIPEIWSDEIIAAYQKNLKMAPLVKKIAMSGKKGDKIHVKSTGQNHVVDSLGVFTPKRKETDILEAGEVGWVSATIKDIHGAPVGDTLTHAKTPDVEMLPGFKKVKPQVYAGMFPVNADDDDSPSLATLSCRRPHRALRGRQSYRYMEREKTNT